MKTPDFKQEKNKINVLPEGSRDDPSQQRVIRSAAFSHDSKYLAVLVDGEDTRAIVWDWFNKTKSRIIGSMTFGKQIVNRIRFHPTEPHVVSTSGHSHWKLWRPQESTFIAHKKLALVKENNIYTDHIWMVQEMMAATTSEGEIIILEDYEQRQVIDNAFGTSEIYNVSCIREFSKGFICASDRGHMAMWVRAEENNSSQSKDTARFDFIRDWQFFKHESIEPSPIISLDISPNGEEQITAACKNNNIYLVNMKSIGLNEQMDKEVIIDQLAKGFHSGPITAMDVAVQRPLILTCSTEDSTIRIWNYYNFTCEHARLITTSDDSHTSQRINPLLTVAMHPSGYYMAGGFLDRIRFYHILHDSIKGFRTIEIQHCRKLKFSNGGHYFIAVNTKHLFLYNSYTLCRVGKPELLPSSHVTDICWNSQDTCVGLCTTDGFIHRYMVHGGLTKLNDGGTTDKQTSFSAIAFANDDSDEAKIVAVGSDGTKGTVKIIDDKEMVRQNYHGREIKTTELAVIEGTNMFKNIIAGTERGNMKVYGLPLASKQFDEFPAHFGEVAQIMVSPDSRFVFSAGDDGNIFIYSVTEFQNETEVFKVDDQKKAETQYKDMIVDEGLADIVLIARDEMENWTKRQEALKNEMEDAKHKLESAVTEVKNKFSKQAEEAESSYKKEKMSLEERHKILVHEKAAQEHENTQNIKKMEMNFKERVEELQALYDKKMFIENSNYLKLEQEKMEMEKKHEEALRDMEGRNSRSIEQLEQTYKNELNDIKVQFDDSKKTAEGLKITYDEKLSQQEDEHETEIAELKEEYDQKIYKLNELISTSKSQNTQEQNKKNQALTEMKQMEKMKSKATNALNQRDRTVDQKNEQIKILQEEKLSLQGQVKEKEHELYKYKFKIKDLQKSKHVLTHRAKGIAASLEPKEKQIESLKEQILNLEKVFEKQMKQMNQHEENLTKKQSKIFQLTQDLNNQKAKTKEKEKTIFKMINDINKYVQQKDEKSYVAGLMQLNQDYVMPRQNEILQKKKKDPETIEELDRQLRYMERSIATIKVNTIKNETRTKNDIKKRTKENTQLIKELNQLRQERDKMRQEIKNLKEQLHGLEFKESQNRRKEGYQAKQSRTMQKQASGEDEQIPSLLGRPRSGMNRGSSSKPKGKLYKGIYRRSNQEDKQKISDLQAQLQDNNQVILMQKLEIRTLKEQVIHMVQDREGEMQEQDASQFTPNREDPGAEDEAGFLPRVESKASNKS